MPAILFLGSDGSRLGGIDGTAGAEALLNRMLDLLEQEKSVPRLRARLKSSPYDLETAWQLAGCYMEEEQWENARPLLETIIKSDPDNKSTLLDNALFARAYIQGKRGNYDRACREFQGCCEIPRLRRSRGGPLLLGVERAESAPAGGIPGILHASGRNIRKAVSPVSPGISWPVSMGQEKRRQRNK